MNRELYLALPVGSHLYGTTHAESDKDWLQLLIPSHQDMISNKRVTIPQQISNGLDIRTQFLGDFVTSLGHNPENTIIALHYHEHFGKLFPYFVNKTTAFNIMTVAEKMWKNAKTPKMRAHAFRHVAAAQSLVDYGYVRYPLEDMDLKLYKYLLNDGTLEEVPWKTHVALVANSDLPDTPTNTDALVEWVWNEYRRYDLSYE